jgi:hypothetical protein
MPAHTNASSDSSPRADADVHYTMRAATIRHDDTTMIIHLVATSRRSALGYGNERLPLGTSLVLSVGGIELVARVGWSDGRRFRLDAELGDDGQLWALLGKAPADPCAGRASANDALPPEIDQAA